MKGRNFISNAGKHTGEDKNEGSSPITSPLLKILRKKREQEAEQKEVKETRRESTFSQLVKEMQMTDGKLKSIPRASMIPTRNSLNDTINNESSKFTQSICEEESEDNHSKRTSINIKQNPK